MKPFGDSPRFDLRKGWFLIVLVAVFVVGAVTLPAKAEVLETLRVNLLYNPGAEEGVFSDAIPSPMRWVRQFGELTVYSATDKFYTVDPFFGFKYFGHKKDTGDASTWQYAHLSDYADIIDNGGVQIVIGGWIISQDGEDDGAIALKHVGNEDLSPWVEQALNSRSSNWSSDWAGDWDAIGDCLESKSWKWVKAALTLPAGRTGAYFFTLADRDAGGNNNVCYDGLVMALSNYTVDLDLGGRYANKNSTARDFNLHADQSRTLALESVSKLNWKIILPASGIAPNEIVVSSGGATADGPGEEITGSVEGMQEINININPPAESSSAYSKQIRIETYTPVDKYNQTPSFTSDHRISTYFVNLNAMVYGTPTVGFVGASKDSEGMDNASIAQNGKINLAVDETLWFEVSSGDPLNPEVASEAKSYQWTRTAGDWEGQQKYPDTKKDFRWTSSGEYSLYCRMVDANDVATDPLEIPVRVWNRPTVGNAPPDAAIAAGIVSWYSREGGDDYYFGAAGEAVALMADGEKGSSEADEYIEKYLWDLDENWDTIELEQPRNLLSNPGFEEGNSSGWSLWPADSWEVIQEAQEAYSGDSFMACSGRGTGAQYLDVSQYTDEIAGGQVTVTFSGYLKSDGLDEAGLVLRFRDASGGTTAESTNRIHPITWTHQVVQTQIPPGTVRIEPYVDSFDGDGGGIYFDDLSLRLHFPTTSAHRGVQHVWDNPNLAGRIRCKAVTNYGARSAEKSFDLKIYRSLEVEPGGPYTGRPQQPLELNGSINETSYSTADILYQWFVKDGDTYVDTVDTDRDGRGEYVWTTDGDFTVEFRATVTTVEGLILTDSASTTAHVESGVPTAMPGGPYRGGIAGGNFSPIQFQGNSPDFVEANDIGNITQWEWSFSGRLMGNVLQFDGVNDCVVLTEPLSIFSGSFTISMWVKIPSDASGRVGVLLGDYGLGGANINFEIYSSGQLRFYWNGNPNVFGTQDLRDDTWHFITFVRDKEGEAVYGYVDGNVDLEYSGSIADRITTAAHRIGRDARTGDPAFEGAIDEVAIFDRALTQAEVQANMNHALTGGESGLVGYWPFDEASGAITADNSSGGNQGTLSGCTWVNLAEASGWNPTHAFPQAGEYDVNLRVLSQFGRWSVAQTTRVEVVDGKISGYVRAADLRTPVREVSLILTSPHVDGDALASIAQSDSTLRTTSAGGIWTETDENGYYAFAHVPLGSYNILATKVDSSGQVHEFETTVQTTELTLDTPTQSAINFVDLSVYPVGGRIVYSIQKNEQDVLVKDVIVKAQPVSSTSPIESLPSSKSPSATGTNYNLPLFAGKYLFKVELGGHDIRLIGTHPNDPSKQTPSGYDASSQLVTIKKAVTDLDFIDYTTRELIVYVEDSGGYPIDVYQGNTIRVMVDGTNGFVEGEIHYEGEKTFLQAIVPPGKYTVSLPNVPTALVKGDQSKKRAEVDLFGEEPQSVTMVVPVKIVLEIGPAPRLFNAPEEFLETIGLTPEDNPEGYMIYFPPEMQEHTYTINATANGYGVEDFTLKVTDNISQLTASPAYEKTYPDPADPRFSKDDQGNGLYTITAGLPKKTAVDENDPNTYLEYTLPDSTTVVKVPIVLPKTVTFKVSKDGYEPSDFYTEEVTVLGDAAEGSASEIVSVPNVNYFVLHDPPGDESYAYIDDSMRMKGVLTDVAMKVNDTEIPVYPSPWSEERTIDDFEFNAPDESGIAAFQDLGTKGVLGYRDSDPTVGHFTWASAVEMATGAAIVASGAVGYAAQVVKMAGIATTLGAGEIIQYEVSPNRHIETPSGDELPDLMGPGKGDLYYGEGWTLGLQTKYRLAIKRNPDYNPDDPNSKPWIPDTAMILTYDILKRDNQYVYTIRDIERIITNLGMQTAAIDTATAGVTQRSQWEDMTNARNTWVGLLQRNPAYLWQNEHIRGDGGSDPAAFETFLQGKGYMDQQGQLEDGQLLIFSGGATFEYSRAIAESDIVEYATSLEIGTSTELHSTADIGTGDVRVTPFAGVNMKAEISWGVGGATSMSTEQSFGAGWESGTESEQTVGFVLSDDEVGDNISTYVYEGPWGTPIFFTDPGSVTSDPWQAGTNKAVDVQLDLLSEENWGPFDYRDGAHYQFRVTSMGKRKLEGSGVDFIFYDLPMDNTHGATVKFNGSDEAPYKMELFKGFSDLNLKPSAVVNVSIYPPRKDWSSSDEREYPVLVQAEAAADYQIAVNAWLKPTFADLRAPRAAITAPYDGQRISPAVFDTFKVEVRSDDEDLTQIQLEIRSKRTDGVWEPWRNLSGMSWADAEDNPNVTVVTHTDRDPVRREFTFEWTGGEIADLGVGEYALRAVASDGATRLKSDGSQESNSNVDLDAPIVTFVVDGSKPTVLTTLPDYQARESERIYRGELSVLFTDDMRADDFSDRTFYVTNLLEGGEKVAGFVSYSPALRKAIFVPVQPFAPNGFYQVEIKTDTENEDGSIERGVHDLAGNPLDNLFMWTFRTTDAPFEETWSIALSVTDGVDLDGNNLAGVSYGALDEEDEKDARAVPGVGDQMRLVFLDPDEVEFDRDARPADGRLSHHWFFVVEHAVENATVTLQWRPSIKLTKSTRQYQVIQLTEFDNTGAVANMISLDPAQAPFDPETGQILEVFAYSYENTATRTIDERTFAFDVHARYFRLDVQKSVFVAGALEAGTSGWKFLSVPITPQRAEPFVNLGDDIDPFQLYQYDTALGGYKIYPLDLGEVGLQSGHGYFTRLEETAEVDVGGTLNQNDVTINLDVAGWHAIGNPFVAPVDVATLQISAGSDPAVPFEQAADGWIEGTLYGWNVVTEDAAFLEYGSPSDGYTPVTGAGGQLIPWQGYWLKTHRDSLALTIPVPSDLPAILPVPEYLVPRMKPSAPHADLQEDFSQGKFELNLAIYSDFASDPSTTLGTLRDAKTGYDGFDRSEPPTLSKTVAVFFDHPDWGERSGWYNRDVQPELEMGGERLWTFTVYTDEKDAEMTLSWERSIAGVPDDVLLFFRRMEEGTDWEDMREVRSVHLNAASRITRIPFEVRAYRPTVEQTMLLPSYPNPFNPEVWIPYELTEEAPVRIEIYNTIGQLVRRLDLGVQAPGRYLSKSRAAYWNGHTEFGEPVGSGVYLCVLRAGNFTETRRMVILK